MAQPAPNVIVDWRGTERYEVLGRLGQGGMGVVYEAFDRERRQLVALKKLLTYDPAGLYLFKQEFRTLADARHTNLVHLYELVVGEGDATFFTMELVRGTNFLEHVRGAPASVPSGPPETFVAVRPEARETLRPAGPDERKPKTQLPRRTRADVDRLRPALRQLVEGIHALHSAGKLHRDVKPSNVLVTPEGRVVLLDFGVATELRGPAGEAASGSGEMVGTARYMAPEQADDEPPTPASDWYSVGVMLYEALVGRAPFIGSTIDILTMKNMMEASAPSEAVEGVPPDLDALCRALLHRDPAMRPDGSVILRRLGVTRSSAPPPQLVARGDGAFIGRSAELETLSQAFEAVRSGRSVTVRVGGASGMGKSTVVHHFLDGLATRGDAIVLRGRAYQREAVPYKAVDTVVDSLSRHLLRLDEDNEPLTLPEDAWLLGRLFPVLQRVPSFGALAAQRVDDPQDVRHRAFGALRILLGSLVERQPVVLFVDDAQWGDVDSAALLLDLLRPPDAPALMLVMTYRNNEERTSPFLSELRERWPPGADLREVEVAPLQMDDALLLALTLLDATDDLAKRTARAVAREARGSPFLIEELVRSNRGAISATGATLAVLTLDQMIAERLERLPAPARTMIEILAVGGRPLPVSVVAAAAGIDDSANETIGLLGARRFLRMGLRDGCDVIEPTHDRIRETIAAQLSEAMLRSHHTSLAHALEGTPNGGADPEAIALHWLGAGDGVRAARFAEGAADQAIAKLAFDQAARLFRFTLEHGSTSSPAETRRLRARLAETLRFAGRCEESARAYLAAAEDASATEKLEFQRAAAEQLLSGGRVDEGKEILHRVLGAFGMSAPRSPLAAVFWLLVYRLWLRFLGLRIESRRQSEVSPEARLRVEALATASLGFAIVDVMVAACMQARHLVEALRYGDGFQLVRAVSHEASHLAAGGGRESRRERELARLGDLLAEKDGTEAAKTYNAAARGIGHFVRGHWRTARAQLEYATTGLDAGNAALVNAPIFAVYAAMFLGDSHGARRSMSRLVPRAEERGDLYTPVNLRTCIGISLKLQDDDPEGARRVFGEAMAKWTQSGFHVQHWQAIAYGPDIDVYAGEPGRAYETFHAAMPALKKSLLLHTGFIRTMTSFVGARLAIASIASHPERARERIAEARRMLRKLRRELDPWAGAIAHLVSATIANATGDRTGAIDALRDGIAALEATDTVVYVPIARHRLGELLGGDEGRELMNSARAVADAQSIRNFDRWMSVYLPGTWSVSP